MRFMTSPATGQAAFYEPLTGGSQFDPTAPQNAPLLDPASHLDKVYLHPDLDYLEVLTSGSVSKTHDLIPGVSTSDPRFQNNFGYEAGSDDQQLATWTSPGYVPYALVAVASNVLSGTPVQNNSDGGARYVTPYVRANELRIKVVNTIGVTDLAAVTLTYVYIVFKNPPFATGNVLFKWDPATGVAEFGLGKWRSDRKYLMVASGGSPLSFAMGRTIDDANGSARLFRADGTHLDPTPSGVRLLLPHFLYTGAIGGYGSVGGSMAYNGSAVAPAAVQVQAP